MQQKIPSKIKSWVSLSRIIKALIQLNPISFSPYFQYSRSSRRLSILPEENEAEDCLSTSSNSNENGEFDHRVFNMGIEKRKIVVDSNRFDSQKL
jgi:hypothetical protein